MNIYCIVVQQSGFPYECVEAWGVERVTADRMGFIRVLQRVQEDFKGSQVRVLVAQVPLRDVLTATSIVRVPSHVGSMEDELLQAIHSALRRSPRPRARLGERLVQWVARKVRQ